MNYVSHRNRREATITLFVTFILGFGIGFSTYFALDRFAGWGRPAEDAGAPERIAQAPGIPVEPVAEPALESRPAQAEEAMPPGGVDETAFPAEEDVPPGEETTPPETVEAAPVPAARVPAAPVEAVTGDGPGRHLFIGVKGLALDDETRALLAAVKPGGVVLGSNNLVNEKQAAAFVATIKDAVGFGNNLADQPLIAVAQEGGFRNPLELPGAPSAAELGEWGSADLARKTGRESAEWGRARGVGVFLSPVLDVYDPSGVDTSLKTRTYSDDAGAVVRIGLGFADGVLEGGVLCVAKHFPGLGSAQLASDGESLVVDKKLDVLAKVIYPFDEAVRRGIPGVLVGHLAVPELCPQEPDRPASLSSVLVGEILRRRWGFDGVVLADDASSIPSVPPDAAVIEALRAGCDAVVFLDPSSERIRTVCSAIEQAAADDARFAESLERSRDRLDAFHERLRKPQRLLTALLEPPPTVAIDVAEEKPPDEAPAESATSRETLKPEAVAGLPPPIGRAGATGDVDEAATESEAVQPPELVVAEPEESGAPGEPVAVDEAPEAAHGTVADTEVPGPAETVVVETEELTAAGELPVAEPAQKEPVPQPPNTKKIVHRIRRGEMLSRIAARYGVRQDDIVAWNALPDTNIKYGTKLLIYVPKRAEGRAGESAESQSEGSETADAPETAGEGDATDSLIETAPYTVRPGDTLLGIAARHGATRDRVMALNGLSDPDHIRVGQVLRVPK